MVTGAAPGPYDEETPAMDWATQAYLNLAALTDDVRLDTAQAGVIATFLEQAPDTIKRVANDVRSADNRVVAAPFEEPSSYDKARWALAELQTPTGLVLGDVIARLILDSGAVNVGSSCRDPHLGLATTGQLLAEVRCRIELGHVGLDYRTVQ